MKLLLSLVTVVACIGVFGGCSSNNPSEAVHMAPHSTPAVGTSYTDWNTEEDQNDNIFTDDTTVTTIAGVDQSCGGYDDALLLSTSDVRGGTPSFSYMRYALNGDFALWYTPIYPGYANLVFSSSWLTFPTATGTPMHTEFRASNGGISATIAFDVTKMGTPSVVIAGTPYVAVQMEVSEAYIMTSGGITLDHGSLTSLYWYVPEIGYFVKIDVPPTPTDNEKIQTLVRFSLK